MMTRPIPFRALGLVALTMFCSTVFSAQKNIDNSNITDVTVFLSGAQVTRKAEVQLKPGENRLRVNGISRHAQLGTVRVTGSDKFTILSVSQDLTYLENPAVPERIELLQKELSELELKRNLRVSLRLVYQEEKSMILANKHITSEAGVLLAEDLQEMADFYRSRLTEIEYKLVEIQMEESDFNAEIGRIRRELDGATADRLLANGFIDLVLEANAATKQTIEVSYMVTSAAWIPTYDVRAEDVDSPLEIVYKGRVLQYSEHDWNEVNLTLSTGNPAAGGIAPELNPWRLYLQEMEAYKQQRVQGYEAQYWGNISSGRAQNDAYKLEGQMAMPATTVAAVANNTLSTEFTIPVKYTIPSDNEYYDVETKRITMDAAYMHFAIPKLDKDAFLLAGITDWEKHALLPGKSYIYFKGTFVGEGFIDPAITGDTLQISLGRDKSVAIKREKIADQCKTTTFGGKKTTTKAYDIEVRNNKTVPVTLTIQDQVPLSTDSTIEVDVETVDGGKYDPETGLVEWEVTLQPGESRHFELRFVVKYPKKKIVSGL